MEAVGFKLKPFTFRLFPTYILHIYSLDPFEILLANIIPIFLILTANYRMLVVLHTLEVSQKQNTPEFKVFVSPMCPGLDYCRNTWNVMWRSGRQMCSEKIAFAYCSACCYCCDCFVVGWPISGVLFEASMIFNDLARNASSTLSLWGCTRCQRPAKGKIAALATQVLYTPKL